MRLCPASPESELASAALWGPGAGARGPRHHPLSLSALPWAAPSAERSVEKGGWSSPPAETAWRCWPGGSCNRSWDGLSSKGPITYNPGLHWGWARCALCGHMFAHTCAHDAHSVCPRGPQGRLHKPGTRQGSRQAPIFHFTSWAEIKSQSPHTIEPPFQSQPRLEHKESWTNQRVGNPRESNCSS